MIDVVAANLREYWMVYTLLAAYTVMLAHHAWAGKKGTKDLADYYVGGRRMGGWAIGLSFLGEVDVKSVTTTLDDSSPRWVPSNWVKAEKMLKISYPEMTKT